MMKKMKIKIAAAILAVASLCALGFGITIFSSDAATNAPQTFKMADGASIRYSDGESTGLRFVSVIDDAEYSALSENYEHVTYGMVILPYDYVTEYSPVNAETLFGADAKYCWQTVEDGKVRILNYVATDALSICDDSLSANYGKRELRCAVVNIMDANFIRDFYAVSYIIAENQGEKEYFFTDDNMTNVRSAVQVAQMAYADESDPARLEVLQSFIDKAPAQYSYKTEHYIPSGDGYTLHDTSTFEMQTLNDKVQAEAIAIDGYSVDTDNALNVTEGTIWYDNSLTLKLYYKNWKTQPENLIQGFEGMETIPEGVIFAIDGSNTVDALELNDDMTYVNGGDKSLKFSFTADKTVCIVIGELLPSRNLSYYEYLSFDITTDTTGYVGKASICYDSTQDYTSAYTDKKGAQLTKDVWRTITIDLAKMKDEGIDISYCYALSIYVGTAGNYYLDNFVTGYGNEVLQGFENTDDIGEESVKNNVGTDISDGAFINTDSKYVLSGVKSMGFTISSTDTIHLILANLLPSNDLSGYNTLSFNLIGTSSKYVGAMSIVANNVSYSGYCSRTGGNLTADTWYTCTFDLAALKEKNPDANLGSVYSLKFYIDGGTYYIDHITAQ